MESPTEPVERIDASEMVGLVLIRTEKELTAFLNSLQLPRSLIISCQIGARITEITRAISKSEKTLERLTLDGSHAAMSSIPAEQTQLLANAISKCTSLNALNIVNFQNAFKDRIQYIVAAIFNLPNIIDLSFDNSYLGQHCRSLFPALRDNTNLRKLNLNRCAMVADDDFFGLGVFLNEHRSIQILDLGDSPIWLSAINSLLCNLAACGPRLNSLLWEPLSFVESEELYIDLSSEINWERDVSKIDRFLIEKYRLENFRKTGVHGQHDLYVQAVSRLTKLQALIAERQNLKPLTTFQYTIKNDGRDNDFNTIVIINQSETLKQIELSFEFNDENNSDYLERLIDNFVNALLRCRQLETLRIHNFHSSLINKFELILKALAELPNFKDLEIKCSYLGEKGADCLAELLKKNTLLSLNLRMAGLISANCFMSLANGLRQCTSLRKLTLGDTPMMASWVKTIIKALTVAQPPVLVWYYNDVATMKEQMTTMCSRLKLMVESNKKPSSNVDFDSMAQIFCSQDLDELSVVVAELQQFQTSHGMETKETPLLVSSGSSPWWSSGKSQNRSGYQELDQLNSGKLRNYGSTRQAKR